MLSKFNELLDKLSDFFAHRKGFLPAVGILLVIMNGIIQFYPGAGWFIEGNIFLHLGVVIALLGVLLAWAL